MNQNADYLNQAPFGEREHGFTEQGILRARLSLTPAMLAELADALRSMGPVSTRDTVLPSRAPYASQFPRAEGAERSDQAKPRCSCCRGVY